MQKNTYNTYHNPDVLSCIANLSSDEIFTPPEVANDMLDLLPQELFESPETKFLDPACKSGVFLREIAKRLLKGLEPVYPDLKQRIDHIFKEQLFGIAITELTSHLSRRSLYCSKTANGKYSVTEFGNAEGNVRYRNIKHEWKNDRCVFCGASKSKYDREDVLESHAYEFIHTKKPEEIFNMKFDVIISNPPYQLSDGGAQASAIPIYDNFIIQAKKLNPSYITMIIPARWMTGGRGLNEFRTMMIHDRHISILHDFIDSKDCFTGVEIKGGVCYYLWEREYNGMCEIYRHREGKIFKNKRYLADENENIYVRYDEFLSIKDKVWSIENVSFQTIVSSMKPYGFRGDVFKDTSKYGLPPLKINPVTDGYKILGLEGSKRRFRYVEKNYPIPKREMLDDYKIFVPRNWGEGNLDDVPSALYLAKPGEMCTETFIQIGPFASEEEAENAYAYFRTKFFRALVGMRKQDQGASRSVYQFVPLQDFSKPWTDEELYRKYKLTKEEINFIESMIKPMDIGGDDNG